MMNWVIIFVAVFCVCQAVPPTTWGPKQVKIYENGTIVITTPQGKMIKVTKPIHEGDRKQIEVVVSVPFGPTKRIYVDDITKDISLTDNIYGGDDFVSQYLREKRSHGSKTYSQWEILKEIFKEYEGSVDDRAFEKLLKKVKKAVEHGHVSPLVYYVLRFLDAQESLEEYLKTYEMEQYGVQQRSEYDSEDKQHGLTSEFRSQIYDQLLRKPRTFEDPRIPIKTFVTETPYGLMKITLEGPQVRPLGPTTSEAEKEHIKQIQTEYAAILKELLQQPRIWDQLYRPQKQSIPLLNYNAHHQAVWPFSTYYPQNTGLYPEHQSLSSHMGKKYQPYYSVIA